MTAQTQRIKKPEKMNHKEGPTMMDFSDLSSQLWYTPATPHHSCDATAVASATITTAETVRVGCLFVFMALACSFSIEVPSLFTPTLTRPSIYVSIM